MHPEVSEGAPAGTAAAGKAHPDPRNTHQATTTPQGTTQPAGVSQTHKPTPSQSPQENTSRYCSALRLARTEHTLNLEKLTQKHMRWLSGSYQLELLIPGSCLNHREKNRCSVGCITALRSNGPLPKSETAAGHKHSPGLAEPSSINCIASVSGDWKRGGDERVKEEQESAAHLGRRGRLPGVVPKLPNSHESQTPHNYGPGTRVLKGRGGEV